MKLKLFISSLLFILPFAIFAQISDLGLFDLDYPSGAKSMQIQYLSHSENKIDTSSEYLMFYYYPDGKIRSHLKYYASYPIFIHDYQYNQDTILETKTKYRRRSNILRNKTYNQYINGSTPISKKQVHYSSDTIQSIYHDTYILAANNLPCIQVAYRNNTPKTIALYEHINDTLFYKKKEYPYSSSIEDITDKCNWIPDSLPKHSPHFSINKVTLAGDTIITYTDEKIIKRIDRNKHILDDKFVYNQTLMFDRDGKIDCDETYINSRDSVIHKIKFYSTVDNVTSFVAEANKYQYKDHIHIQKYNYKDSTFVEQKAFYIYTYDHKGNWITRQLSHNGVIIKTILRTILYYDE